MAMTPPPPEMTMDEARRWAVCRKLKPGATYRYGVDGVGEVLMVLVGVVVMLMMEEG